MVERSPSFPKLYPFVKGIHYPDELGQGPWPKGRPLGVTLHHSAHGCLHTVIDEGRQKRIGYHLVVDRDGKVHQTAYLDRYIFHAGRAGWLGRSPNRYHLAVCVISWGRLKQDGRAFQSWSGAEVPGDDAVYRPGRDNVYAWWHGASVKQEKATLEILSFAVSLGIEPESIAGHDEVALPLGRKDDPGGVLSVSMREIRRGFAERGIAWWAK